MAVYLDGSGMTHLVDPVSAEVLLYLAGGERTPESIQSFVARLVGSPEPSWGEIEALLLRPLEAAGMAEALT